MNNEKLDRKTPEKLYIHTKNQRRLTEKYIIGIMRKGRKIEEEREKKRKIREELIERKKNFCIEEK